jgi:hypothetical protein
MSLATTFGVLKDVRPNNAIGALSVFIKGEMKANFWCLKN